ncbi:hypothetical protein ACYOEI_37870, partial [Singulisphaera rosea]
EPIPLTAVPRPEKAEDSGPSVEITVPDTRRAGLYRISWDEGPLGSQQDFYASNPDPRESTLERIGGSELKELLRPLKVEVVPARGDATSLFAATGHEIWYELACGLLVLLILESIFATWVGRSR